MRKLRENLPNRVCNLISRVAHRASFLNAEERTRGHYGEGTAGGRHGGRDEQGPYHQPNSNSNKKQRIIDMKMASVFLAFAAVCVFASARAVTKSDYLDIMEAAVAAYSDGVWANSVRQAGAF